MRVLHILDHSAPLQSGYVSRTLCILRAQRALGVEPYALTSPRHGAEAGPPAQPIEHEAGFEFYRTPAPARALPGLGFRAEVKATAARLAEAVRELRPALIHAHSPVLNALPALKVARAAGVPLVYEIRAFWEDAAVDRGTTTEGSMRYRLTRTMETRAVKRADHVFTICNGLREDIVARGIAPERVDLAPNAIEPGRLHPVTERDTALAKSLGLGDGPVLGFLGSFYHYEGLHLLLEAFPRIRERWPNAKLLFVGGGPEDAALRAAAEPLGDAVIFTGRVPPEEVRRHYSVVDLLVYPRLRMRLTDLVTPLKPLEAMSLTRPFIASDVGGHRELVEDGVTGHLFRASDAGALAEAALAALDPAQAEARRATIAPGRAFVMQERNWEAVARRYLPVYERLTGQVIVAPEKDHLSDTPLTGT